MKHFILDESVVYNEHHNSYHFPTQHGDRPCYIKVKGDLVPDKNGILEDNNFNFIRSRYGDSMFVPGSDRSMRAVVFLGVNGFSHEVVEIDEEFTVADVHYTYTTETALGTSMKIVAVIHPRKPLVIKYTNRYTGKVRIEYVIYNYYSKSIERKHVSPDEWKDLRQHTEIINDYEFDIPKNVTAEYIKNLDDEERAKIEEWFERFHSFMKDA